MEQLRIWKLRRWSNGTKKDWRQSFWENYYPGAVTNARRTVEKLLAEGLPGLEDTDERNRWLQRKCLTVSNVYEAIEFLESLEKL